MADDPLPFIEEKDFGAFQRIFENAALPANYEEWLKFYERERRDRERKGHTCYAVPVDPNDFVEFCRSQGQEPNEIDNEHFLVLLLRFAITNAPPPCVASEYDPLESKD